MAYKIETLEYHENCLNRSKANSERILSDSCWENSESGLSLWGDSVMGSFHRYAIEMIKLGQAMGIDGPADSKKVLVDADGNVVSNRMIEGQWGSSWLVGEEGEKRFGRAFIPIGEKSRVQKNLGLSEEYRVVPVSNYLDSRCAFVGAPVSFSSIPLEKIPSN